MKLQRTSTARFGGINGPHLLTRAIKNLCGVSNFSSKRMKKCENFFILPASKCYSIGWEEWEKFFQANQLHYVRKRTKDSFFVHLWNHLSDKRIWRKSDETALNEIAAKYCPRVYATEEKVLWSEKKLIEILVGKFFNFFSLKRIWECSQIIWPLYATREIFLNF